MDQTIKKLMKEMTLEEKALLCTGADFWHLKGVERLNIPTLAVADGPHGIRKQLGESDHLGINTSVAATCFPTASCIASSWDRSLQYEVGIALAEECLQEDIQILLGPGVNIKRLPICGRNFEYYSEDPFLSGELASAYIQGVQSMGVGTSLKHFAANNQEYRRMTLNSIIDERTLVELYLPAFERAVIKAKPMTIMSAYNKLNGEYCSEHGLLLTSILRASWQFKGIVISDWGAVHHRPKALKSGLDIDMPGSPGISDYEILKAIQDGELSLEDLDQSVERILKIIFKLNGTRRKHFVFDKDEHHAIAKRAAVESMVLLKNSNAILPISPAQEVVFIGELFERPRYQGSGSSMVNPLNLISSKERLDALGFPYKYYKGYSLIEQGYPNELLLKEALEGAEKANIVVVFVGLSEQDESEGFDREHIELPIAHNELISQLAAQNDRVVVVLQNGSPVAMPWINSVKGVFEAYLGGEASGEAIIDLIYGLEVPSGKLAETFPIDLESCAAMGYYRESEHATQYREGLYVGYRDYNTFKKPVLFPFGHGMSYTQFSYERLHLSHKHIGSGERLSVSVKVRNIGSRRGAEIIQVYVHDADATMYRPEDELKGFEKIWLEPGESQVVRFVLKERAFAYWNEVINDWHVEPGRFEIRIGKSSRDILLRDFVLVDSHSLHLPLPDLRSIIPEYYLKAKKTLKVSEEAFLKLIRGHHHSKANRSSLQLTLNSTLGELRGHWFGNLLYAYAMHQFSAMARKLGHDERIVSRMKHAFDQMPIKSVAIMSSGKLPLYLAKGLVDLINGKWQRGLKRLISRR